MKLLSPIDINGMIVPNRTVVPAMVTRLSGEDGYVNEDIINRYARYSEGHVGLIVVEAMAIHQSKSGPLLRISDDKFIPGHAELVKRIHDSGPSKVVPQIIHFMKVARSGWRQTIDSLTDEDIDGIIRQFGDAAARAREAGYDGVELHSAHAYTLSSFLSRHNKRRDEYGGRTLETRLRMFGEVMAEVRSKVGHDWPVGVRFLADEMIKDGYTVEDSKKIALRMAQLGVDYISLSVGGKFEDAVYREGQPLYPYTGYSGDRCMPGNQYPSMPHVHYTADIKKYINDRGMAIPVFAVGKISNPADAEKLLQDGKADMIGMARQLLADPDWPRKIETGRRDEIVHCIYCNVCKQLDENFKEVNCFLWPKNARQAPSDDPGREAPTWSDAGAELKAAFDKGAVKLSWNRMPADNVIGYDVYRADEFGEEVCVEAVKSNKFADKDVLAGQKYTYYVRGFDETGHASVPSNVLEVDLPFPHYEPRSATPKEKAL